MSEKFEREERYIVFKVKDLSQHKLGWVRDVIRLNGIPTVDAVVVESDWPEYEPTWAAIKRRVTGTVQWDGEGLPPVGTVCEIAASTQYLSIRHPEGAKVKVYANFTDDRGVELAAFVDEIGQVAGVCTGKCFRPIRTPEQIAAEQRDKATATWLETVAEDYGQEVADQCAQILAGAGYRKQVTQ